jgi:PAS domain S-box-containing protein
LFASIKGKPKYVGAVILQSDANQFLYPLIRSWPVPSRTAETLLVRRDGDTVLFLNDLRHRKDVALRMRIPLSQTNVPAVMAVSGKEGVVVGEDYRGIKVLSILKAIPDSPWFMVAKMDEAEVFEKSRFFSVLILALVLGLVAAGAAVVVVVWQSNAKAQYRALFRAEEARRMSEERHRITLMSVGDGVISTDAQGRVELLNPVTETLTGWSQDEARGRPLEEVFRIVNEKTRKDVENPVRRVMREGLVVGLANHTILIARDGTERPIADSGAPIHNERNEITGVVLVFRDRTEERAAELALSVSEERYRGLFQHMREGFAYCQMIFENGEARDFVYHSVNDAFESLTGLKGVTGKRVSEVIPGIRESDPELFRIYGRVALTGTPEKFETFVEALHQWFSISVYCPERGFFVAVFDVITERKRDEEEKLNLERQVQQTQKMESLGVLAGGIAHDFNNILMVVLGHAELALKEISPMSAARGSLTEITTAARRAAELCRQMLAYAGKASFALERVELRDLVEEMAHLLKTAISKKAILNLNLERGLPPIEADPSQIRQIVMNLIINASEAIGDRSGVITVSVGATRCDEEYLRRTELHDGLAPGLYVHLEVTDTGIGIDAETRERIFEPFFSTKFTGRGLGLAAVQGIVRAHKGALKVYSEPGKGTTFKILFPALEDAGEGVRTNDSSPLAAWRGKGTILLVDDEESLLALGARMLEQLGFTVLTATDGREAVERYRELGKEIDLVLMDLTMPHMDGAEAFGELRRLNPHVRVVLASGYSHEDVASRFAGKGLSGVLQKPYTLAKLRESLAGLLPKRLDGKG